MATFPYSGRTPGVTLSKAFRHALIVDTCDGWMLDDEQQFDALSLSEEEEARLREKLRSRLKRADQVWCTSKALTEATAAAFPDQPGDKFVDLVQGYELGRGVHEGVPITFASRMDQAFIIGYAGRFLPTKKPIEPLMKGLDQLKEADPRTYERLRVRVWDYGLQDDLCGRYLRRSIANSGHASVFDILDWMPEMDLVEVLNQCDALFAVQGDEELTKKKLPTKLFLYLAAARPILTVCPQDSELARFMPKSGAGSHHTPDDDRGLAQTIAMLAAGQVEGKAPGIARDYDFLKQYSIQDGVIPTIGKLLGAEVPG
jgi:hypothetical protein